MGSVELSSPVTDVTFTVSPSFEERWNAGIVEEAPRFLGVEMPATAELRARSEKFSESMQSTQLHEINHTTGAIQLGGFESVKFVTSIPSPNNYYGLTVVYSSHFDSFEAAQIAAMGKIETADDKEAWGFGSDMAYVENVAKEYGISPETIVIQARETLNSSQYSKEVLETAAYIATYLQSVYPKEFPVIPGRMLKHIYARAMNEVNAIQNGEPIEALQLIQYEEFIQEAQDLAKDYAENGIGADISFVIKEEDIVALVSCRSCKKNFVYDGKACSCLTDPMKIEDALPGIESVELPEVEV